MTPLKGWLFIIVSIAVLAKVTAKQCNTIPAFLRRLRNGVDVTQLDLLPLDSAGDDGFKYPVLDFTCNLNQSMQLNGVTYEKPDQIESISNTPSGWLNSDTRIHKTSHSAKSSTALNAGLDVLKGIFSASGSYKKMQDYLTYSSKYIEEVSSSTVEYKVTVKPSLVRQPGSTVTMHIDKRLSKTLDSNTIDGYMQFIKTFGTHFWNEGTFGGLLRLILTTDQEYFKDQSDSAVKMQAKATFFKIVKPSAGLSVSTQNIDTKFIKSTTQTIRYCGGNTNLFKTDGISAWQPTVAANPCLLNGKLTEISNIVSDTSKKAAMQRAVEIYIDQAYLQELLRLVRWRYTAKNWNTHKDILKNYQTKLQTLISQTMPNHTEILSLGTEIESAASVPDWFQNTQLCYNWYPDGDGNQCGKGAAGKLCAKVNSMTTYYRDDTDRRGGGCQMQWGIISSGYDDWFKDVQICYKWWPDGDRGQCGGGASGELCASVNSYTAYYRDDTDRRGGGCQMQWKLSVPSSSPLWMQNAKICFDWYPDGDGGQCGGSAPRNLCATANSYTRAYRDDTDRRGGGCQMRWGIEA